MDGRQRKTAYTAHVSGGLSDTRHGAKRLNVFQDNSATVNGASSLESHFAPTLTNFSACEAAKWAHSPL